MALPTSPQQQQSFVVIEEYLTTARMCIDKPKPGGGFLGYPATLLLLCVVDSIGNALLPPNRQSTRLDILLQPPFSITPLTGDQVEDLTHWYRNSLAHTATLPANVVLDTQAHGQPFDFDTNHALTLIRVPVLYDVVLEAWNRQDKTAFTPGSVRRRPPDPAAQPPGRRSTLSPDASGHS